MIFPPRTWWLALVVLLLNDHLLKHAGVLPTWATGKLSDFAGLIVAPWLLVAIVGARRTSTRLACLAAVAIGFVAINLSPTASDTVVELLGAVGLRWRLWPDPSDLIALAILPLAWRCTAPTRQAAHRYPSRWPLVVHATAVTAGAFACVATSYVQDFSFGPFIVNRSHAPVFVDVRRFRHDYPCGDPTLGLGRPLRVDDFEPPHDGSDPEWEINVSATGGDDTGTGDDTASSDTGSNGESDPWTSTGWDPSMFSMPYGLLEAGAYEGMGPRLAGECGAVWVQVDHTTSVIVAWVASAERGHTSYGEPTPAADDTEFYKRVVSIEGPHHALQIGVGSLLTLVDIAPPQG